MNSSFNNIRKIFSLIICLVLLITTIVPSINSERNVEENMESSIKERTRGFFYDFLTNLVDKFPFLENSTIIQRLLEIFSEPTDPKEPNVNIIKNSDVESAKIGETIIYSYKVENTGSQDLSSIIVTDDKLGDVQLNTTILSPGQWAYGEKSYVVDENDIPGPIVNTATVTADYCNKEDAGQVEDNDVVSVSIETDKPLIELEKEASVDTATVGEEIIYSYKVENIGDVVIYNIFVVDDLLGSISLNDPDLCLYPGEWCTGEAVYTVEMEDCGSSIVNTAVVNGSFCSPYGTGFVENSDTESVLIECPKPDIEIEKDANLETAKPGDTITYKYTVTNTGDVPLSNIFAEDDLLGSVSLNKTNLQPGQWATGELCYTVSKEDCGSAIENNVIVNGSYCYFIGSGYVEDEANESVSITCGKPSIKLLKKASTNLVSVGETITYYYFVYNTGAVDLYDVKVTDDPLGDVPLNTTTLSPGEWAYGERTYTVKESDFPYPIENKAVAEGYTSTQEKVVDRTTLILYFEMPCQEDVWVDDSWHDQSDVDDYNSDLYWQVNAFRNIKDAIDIVCECGTVHVLSGFYHNQIMIDKSLNLIAEGDVMIDLNPSGYTIDGSSEIFRPIIFAYGGELNGNNIVTTKKISVKVDGFHINGRNDAIAILYHNVESGCTPALITNNIIEDSGVGIQIQGCTNDTTITWNVIKYHSHTSGKIGVLIESINDCEPENVEIHHNKIGIECGNHIGIWNKVSNIVNAEYNWWGTDDGPQSPNDYDNYDAITGRIADGFGDEVRGQVHFDPWAGVESSGTITKEFYPYDETYDYLFRYDASDSFGYSLDGTPLGLDYRWDFGDNHFSTNCIIQRIYDIAGTYHVKLKISALDQDLDPNGYLTDTSKYTVVQDYTP